jgi:hypothetical protein
MPAKKRPKPLYQRGRYTLHKRPDRANLEIVWYDAERKRERGISAGTADVGEGKLALDRLYLTDTGSRICPSCHRPIEHEGSPLLVTAIADYLIMSEGKAGIEATRNRLGHVTDYIAETDFNVTCAQIDEAWVERFRKWLLAKPVRSPKGIVLRNRSLSHVEGCVMQLVAAINATPGERASFKAHQMNQVSDSPTWRASIEDMARMFEYALAEDYRSNLLRFLQMAVATWSRPEAIFDITDTQWHSAPRVLDLNPKGRRQTKKHRPMVPIARQFAPLLDELSGQWLSVTTVRASWDKMRAELKLPSDRQCGPKVIRRSMATIARKRIGEANWRQGEIMLGHVKSSTSDIYALPDPANLGMALAATESIIDEVEKLSPGAFYRTGTAKTVLLSVIKGGRNG